jgi:hypothetical protein
LGRSGLIQSKPILVPRQMLLVELAVRVVFQDILQDFFKLNLQLFATL